MIIFFSKSCHIPTSKQEKHFHTEITQLPRALIIGTFGQMVDHVISMTYYFHLVNTTMVVGNVLCYFRKKKYFLVMHR